MDSVPAVLAVTRDPFIVYSSNLFAILSLRALYFTIAGFLPRVYYLQTGIAATLVFVGLKMIASEHIRSHFVADVFAGCRGNYGGDRGCLVDAGQTPRCSPAAGVKLLAAKEGRPGSDGAGRRGGCGCPDGRG